MIRGLSLTVATALVVVPTLGNTQNTAAPVVVTATRTPVTADDALAAVSVITREEIERRQPRSLPDLLQGMTGVNVTRSGGDGKAAGLFLRGTNSDHSLLLIDGVRVGSATLGRAAIEDLPVAQIERIEVVRGPRSTLYGADAVGGVIQIFTRDSGAHVSVGAGSEDTWSLDTGVGESWERGSVSVNAATYATDGFDATDEGNIAPDPDDDGYSNRSVSARGEFQATDNLTLSARALRAEADTEFDGTPDESDSTQQALSGALDWQINDAWNSRLSVGQSVDDLDSRAFGGDRFVTRRDTASWQNDLYWHPSHVTTLGIDYYRDSVDSTIDYAEDERDNLGVFAQHQWYAGDADLQLGLRHDDNEAFGGNTTGSAAAGYQFLDELRGFVSFATAFKAPTFNDLYYPQTTFFRGNPDLEPEESRSWEVGLEGGERWQWRVNAFRTEIDDLIVFDAATARSENVAEARIDGVEAELVTNLAGVDARLGATYLDPRDEDTDLILPRRARRSAFLALDRRWGQASFGTLIQYTDESFDDRANTTKLAAYAVVDLTAAWHFSPQWTLRAKVANAFDEDYQTVDTFNTRGRSVFVSLTWREAEQP